MYNNIFRFVENCNYFIDDLRLILYRDGEASVYRFRYTKTSENEHLIIPAKVTQFNKYRVTFIMGGSFINSPFKSITLPDSIVHIAPLAFRNSRLLTSINSPNSVIFLEKRAFEGCKNLENIDIACDHPLFSTMDGVLFSKEIDRLICYPPGLTADAYAIPDTVTSVCEFAFKDCRAIKRITIPGSIPCIREYTFAGCSALTDVHLPDGLMIVREGAFKDCTSLTHITLPGSVKSIRENAFAGCTSLTSITLPDGMKSIRDGAFAGCTALTSITIPSSVMHIGEHAFDGCPSLVITNRHAAGGITDEMLQIR